MRENGNPEAQDRDDDSARDAETDDSGEQDAASFDEDKVSSSTTARHPSRANGRNIDVNEDEDDMGLLEKVPSKHVMDHG